MKNKEIFIVFGIIVIALILVIALGKDSNKKEKLEDNQEIILERAQEESASVKDTEKKQLEEIDVTRYLDYYGGEESKLVLVARPTCHYCQIAEPIIQNLAYKYDINIYYLNTDNFKDDDEEKFKSSNEMFTGGFGTPLLLNIGTNKIIDTVDGLTDSEHYIKFFKDNGYIK